jgi:hypothetical protein
MHSPTHSPMYSTMHSSLHSSTHSSMHSPSTHPCIHPCTPPYTPCTHPCIHPCIYSAHMDTRSLLWTCLQSSKGSDLLHTLPRQGLLLVEMGLAQLRKEGS